MSLLSLCLKARLTKNSLGLGSGRFLWYVPSEPLPEGSSSPSFLGLGLNRLLGYLPSEPPSEGSSDPKTLLA